jgi:hypothetical protein
MYSSTFSLDDNHPRTSSTDSFGMLGVKHDDGDASKSLNGVRFIVFLGQDEIFR